MKKIIATVLITIIILPSITFAQTTPSHDELVQQLISLLLDKIKLLQTQLAQLQMQQKETSNAIQQLTQKVDNSISEQQATSTEAIQAEADRKAWEALPICTRIPVQGHGTDCTQYTCTMISTLQPICRQVANPMCIFENGHAQCGG